MYQKVQTYTCISPILLLFFNRRDTIEQTLSQITRVKPPRIYLACDGGRNEQEKAYIADIRKFVLDSISWECDIHARFLESNHGCKMAVSEAISWFFEHEEQGIIIEDDCLPNMSFFAFCDELLEKYKQEQNVFMINGWSALDFARNISRDSITLKARLQTDYYFSKYGHIWGWASWARAWKYYQREFSDFEREFQALDNFCCPRERNIKYRTLKTYAQGKIDTWDYPWSYSIWKQKGLCIYPKVNMISNIGFNRADAAHTTGDSKFAYMPQEEMHFPLTHPQYIAQDKALDKENFLIVFNQPTLLYRILRKVYKLSLALKQSLSA